jgi:hypothetical protein
VLISTAILPEYFYSLQNWDAPETIGVEIVYPHQLVLTFPAKQTMTLT